MTDQLNIRKEDFQTPAWRRLKADLKARISELRRQNDSSTLTELQTAAKRGAIAELKRILALEKSSAGESEAPQHPLGGNTED